MVDPLKKINRLKGVYFHWSKGVNGVKGGEEYVRQAGFIAQDVQQVLPEGVGEAFEGKFLGVKYEAILSLVVEALKELSQKVELLEKQIEDIRHEQQKPSLQSQQRPAQQNMKKSLATATAKKPPLKQGLKRKQEAVKVERV